MKIFSSFLKGYFFLKTHTRENMFLLLKNLLLPVSLAAPRDAQIII